MSRGDVMKRLSTIALAVTMFATVNSGCLPWWFWEDEGDYYPPDAGPDSDSDSDVDSDVDSDTDTGYGDHWVGIECEPPAEEGGEDLCPS
ncbi:MAG: hypothetical protein JRF63_12985, partial [Deltaproteobacteria bacterium]|nr:hypothetical protein [Deltaproteobacteria bacterium]